MIGDSTLEGFFFCELHPESVTFASIEYMALEVANEV
jgi:hypothetical protein